MEDAGAPVIDLRSRGPAAGTLALGSDPAGLMPDAEVAELERTVSRLPGALLRRIGEARGAGVAEALGAAAATRASWEAVRTEMGRGRAGTWAPPRWLAELAATLLPDTGAQARDGMRTAGMRLDLGRQRDGGHRAVEIETGDFRPSHSRPGWSSRSA